MKYIKIIFIVGLLLGFSGCAQKALMQNMTVKHIDKQTLDLNYQDAISIQSTNGGTETSSMGASQISNEEFKKAVIASLINAGLYSKDGKYKLKIEIIDVDQPSFGFDMTVTMTVKYTLLNYEDKSIVFQKIIKSPYTATVSDAFVGVTRLMLANEGSAKENIYKLLKEFQTSY